MRRAFLIMRPAACGTRHAATFTVFPQAAGRTPHASLFIPYYIYAKNFLKNIEKSLQKILFWPPLCLILLQRYISEGVCAVGYKPENLVFVE